METEGDINLSTQRLLFLSVIRPSIEYIWREDLGGKIWEGNKGQVAA